MFFKDAQLSLAGWLSSPIYMHKHAMGYAVFHTYTGYDIDWYRIALGKLGIKLQNRWISFACLLTIAFRQT
ncbi:MAG: hypothetical protein HRT92_09625 [Piscirickettsiaceae bacterium]|nr:hypothetical protein [Piscirickettsiaceae bacterium]